MKTTLCAFFYFVDKFLTLDGDVFLFHLDEPHIFKEIRSYLDSYNFWICMKWANVNSLPLASVEDPEFFPCPIL